MRNNVNGIYFDTNCWQQFVDNMGLMKKYLSGDDSCEIKLHCYKKYPFNINFNTSYGTKSILLAYEEESLYGK